MNPMPKILPVRSERYLKFIRSKPCLVCGSTQNIQAMHQNLGNGIMGGKASDLQTVPGCNECHRKEHNMGWFTFWMMEGQVSTVESEIESWMAKKCLEYLNEFISTGCRF